MKPMQNNFTIEDLVLLLYKETDASKSLAIFEALQEQPELLAEFEQLSQAKALLPKVHFSPSDKSIDKILNYSEHRTLV